MQLNFFDLRQFSALLIATAILLSQPAYTQDSHVHQHDMADAGAAAAAEVMQGLAGIAVDFELLDRNGDLVTDEDFHGRYLLLGFGFTRCTDVCPLMALNIARVLQAIDQPAAGVFVSVDTERDTPAAVDNYSRVFDERIVGLSGSVEQINQAIRNFNAKYVVTKTQDGITVQHTSHLYAIDPDGRLLDVFAFMTPAEDIAAVME